MNTEKALELVQIIGRAIMDAGQIPSGQLYAAIMGKVSLETYQSVIGLLTRQGIIRNENHLLIWNIKN